MGRGHRVSATRDLEHLHHELQRLLATGQPPILGVRLRQAFLQIALQADDPHWSAYGFSVAVAFARRIVGHSLWGLGPEEIASMDLTLAAASNRQVPPLPGADSWPSRCSAARGALDRHRLRLDALLSGSTSEGDGGAEGVSPSDSGSGTLALPVVARIVSVSPPDPAYRELDAGQILRLRIDAHLTLGRSDRPRLAIDGEIGADARAMLEEAVLASGELACHGAPPPQQCWFRVRWDEPGARLVGRSAGLAAILAAATARAILASGFVNRRLSSGVAVTGELQGTRVVPVEPSTLAQKARACFFAPVQSLYAPRHQVEPLLLEVRRLQEEYPARQMMVVGIGDAREAWTDPSIVRVQPRGLGSAVGATARRVAGTRLAIGLAGTAALLLAGLAANEAARSRNLPVSAVWEGDELVVLNRWERVCARIDLPSGRPNPAGPPADRMALRVAVLDAIGGPPQEILAIHQGTLSRDDRLCLFDRHEKVLWSKDATVLPAALGGAQSDLQWIGVYPLPARSDGGRSALTFRKSIMTFWSFIDRIDLATGASEGCLPSLGHMEGIWRIDLDRDGTPEWIALGTDNRSGHAVMAVLEPEGMTNRTGCDGEGKLISIADPAAMGGGVRLGLRFVPDRYDGALRVHAIDLQHYRDDQVVVTVIGTVDNYVNYIFTFARAREPHLESVQLTDGMVAQIHLRRGSPLTREERQQEERRLADGIEILTPDGWRPLLGQGGGGGGARTGMNSFEEQVSVR